MIVTTKRDLIMSVAERWRRQYPAPLAASDKEEIYERLTKLNLLTCSAEEVAAVIGNESWTRMKCDECGIETDWLICVGAAPDLESSTAHLCRSCAGKVGEEANAL